ncbi:MULTISPECIES: GAF and ANTAR domain-containing protein [Streptomyces]|uniref:GAF and ANTAR domain-containing protein n=3 Tax=Streptomyces rimosus TaxID=1927 RepID=L8EZX3_STRR1|nr:MULTISPECIES: GAF and ANTAR domain-containing protein [Streptomyces]KOG76464.1 transcriptional regulator [Kitasatospora aureofaciens]MYT48272.1 ANTAR domain-containing protein [Streptomyces sp. SID5471]KEF03563.1 transcriptional regulator [Streptomyces rimosus]KEF21253.1 transcriptional regulator [Streptomyces rimosus]KOT41201.1 transcriptional regulator [Streptomyces sp. NRRL WC-3701]
MPAEHERVSREEEITSAFVELADTLVAEFDVMDFLHTLTERTTSLLPVDAAGVILLNTQGRMIDATASDERTRRLELAQIEWQEGPCRDCIRTGAPIPDTPLDTEPAQGRWPRFTEWAAERGFVAAAAVPLRLRTTAIGALNLFRARLRPMDHPDLRLAQALADAATIGILQYRAIRDQTVINEQLEGALGTRVVIEQAKGMLAERLGLSPDEAFQRLRTRARHHQILLTELSRQVISGKADPEQFTGPPS